MARASKVYIALLHHPMRNRRGEVITTSVTNLDLHDIARAARTYEVEAFFVVHPSPSQHELIRQILGFWQEGYGGEYNADRREAFDRVRPCRDLEEVKTIIRAQSDRPIITVATTARPCGHRVAYASLRSQLEHTEGCYLLLFGTGFGMDDEYLRRCDLVLEPIAAAGDYNHLAVRSAVAIILDRLLGAAWFEPPGGAT